MQYMSVRTIYSSDDVIDRTILELTDCLNNK